jgi:hypothetical protein
LAPERVSCGIIGGLDRARVGEEFADEGVVVFDAAGVAVAVADVTDVAGFADVDDAVVVVVGHFRNCLRSVTACLGLFAGLVVAGVVVVAAVPFVVISGFGV